MIEYKYFTVYNLKEKQIVYDDNRLEYTSVALKKREN
jgi:hypothetical protein